MHDAKADACDEIVTEIDNEHHGKQTEVVPWFRFAILALASLMLFGHYFAYDSIGMLSAPISSTRQNKCVECY